jgi:tetratricopeptide (TPR) repeat protein
MFLSNTRALRAAERYLRRGRLAAAIAKYERLVDRNPGDLTAANSLGDLYVRAGRAGAAVAVFSTMAEHFYTEGFLPRAIAMLKKVIKLDPSSIEALAKLAELNERVGRKAEAIEWHRRLASVFESRAQPQKAMDIRNFIARIDATNVASQIAPGDALDLNQAIEQMVPSEDEFVIKQIFLAEVLAIRGGFDEAITILREILSFAPDNVPARSKLKDVYLRAGLSDLAVNEALQLARIREARKMNAIGYLEYELEFGLIDDAPSIDEPPIDEPPSFEPGLDPDSGFQFFAKSPITFNRRNIPRIPMSLPVLVISANEGWREFAETVNVSPSGILLRLGHSVNLATTLRATLPMPLRMRTSDSRKGLYLVNGIVRHAVPDAVGDNLVGIEFEVKPETPRQSSEMVLDCNQALTSE